MKKIRCFNKNGFSLLELIVAILLIGVLYSIILRQGWDHRVMDLQKTTRHLVSDLRWARTRAIRSRKDHYIFLDLESNSYRVGKKQDGKKKILREKELGDGLVLKDFSLNEDCFHFTPTGAPSRGNTITIEGERSIAKIITRVGTGRVRVDIAGKEG